MRRDEEARNQVAVIATSKTKPPLARVSNVGKEHVCFGQEALNEHHFTWIVQTTLAKTN